MSNPNAPFGLKPVRRIDGTPYNGATVRAYISASYGTALYIGDPIEMTTTLSYKDTTAKGFTIIQCAGTDGTIVKGVIESFEPLPTDLSKTYNPASTERWANIIIDPECVYQIRGDGSGTPTKVYPGQNANMVNAGGSTYTGLSGFQLDESTPSADQSNTLYILGLADLPDNTLGTYAIWEVLLNTPENATGRFLGITAS